MHKPDQRVAFGDWAEAVELEDTAVFTSLFTGEVCLRYGRRDYEFMSWSADQRRFGPHLDREMKMAVQTHAADRELR